MLGFLFVLAILIGCGKLNLVIHNEVGALCWLSTRLGHSRTSELQQHRPGYRAAGLFSIWQCGHTDSRPLLGMVEVKDMKQWVTHSL